MRSNSAEPMSAARLVEAPWKIYVTNVDSLTSMGEVRLLEDVPTPASRSLILLQLSSIGLHALLCFVNLLQAGSTIPTIVCRTFRNL